VDITLLKLAAECRRSTFASPLADRSALTHFNEHLLSAHLVGIHSFNH